MILEHTVIVLKRKQNDGVMSTKYRSQLKEFPLAKAKEF
jgi:hypothetical protein